VNIPDILTILMTQDGYSQASLANLFKVDPSTISRWANQESEPRIHTELLIKQIAIQEGIFTETKTDEDADFRKCFDAALKKLRESFHRKSKLSSRNELLEELGKVLFCQVSAIKHDDDDPVSLSDSLDGKNLSIEFVKRTHVLLDRYLPRSLDSEIPRTEFYLRIREDEHQLVRANIVF